MYYPSHLFPRSFVDPGYNFVIGACEAASCWFFALELCLEALSVSAQVATWLDQLSWVPVNPILFGIIIGINGENLVFFMDCQDLSFHMVIGTGDIWWLVHWSFSTIMTPCRTEKVDFSKKNKTESPKKQIDRKNHQMKQEKQKIKNCGQCRFWFFWFFFVFVLLFSCFFLGFGFLVCFFCLLWFCFFLFFLFFCQTLYSLCCWTHNSTIYKNHSPYYRSPMLTPGWEPEGPAQKNSQGYLGYLPPNFYPSSCFLYVGVVSEFYSPDTFTIKYKSSTCSWLSVPRNFSQEGFWYMKQFKQGFWTFCLDGIVRDRFPNPQG